VCVCVCVFVCKDICGNTRPVFTKFLCVLPMAGARFSCGGVVIRYVVPVLWMTSYLCNVHKSRQLTVAAQLMEAQPPCSLGLGYKWHVGIPIAGQWTHTQGPTFRVPWSGPTRPQWAG